MRILLLTPWYPNEKNPGAGVFIKSQAKALSAHHAVSVISSMVDYESFAFSSFSLQTTLDQNVQEYRVVVKKSFPIFNQLNYLCLLVNVSLKIGRVFRPDIIHAHVGYPSAIWAWCLSKLLRVPFVVTEHTRPSNNFRSAIHKWLTIFGMKRASLVIAVSKMLANEVKLFIKRDVVVVSNIVETERFDVVPYVKSEITQIGFLGTLNQPVKGLDIFLRAAAELKTDFVLHIGGSGKLLQFYKTLSSELGIEQKCNFYGFVLPSEVPAFMSRLHFFVCASRSETFCVALAEAMAAGRPVVSTRCGGPEEFVDDRNGVLVNVEDVESLRKGIEKMIQKCSRYNSASISKPVSDRFSQTSFLKRINEIYIAL
ncbi:MAG: glycosyltransferase [Cyclobacteriaceae bacterium]|nr:glycosyltransferase [Cyclobacteriaceae bacterium]